MFEERIVFPGRVQVPDLGVLQVLMYLRPVLSGLGPLLVQKVGVGLQDGGVRPRYLRVAHSHVLELLFQNCLVLPLFYFADVGVVLGLLKKGFVNVLVQVAVVAVVLLRVEDVWPSPSGARDASTPKRR